MKFSKFYVNRIKKSLSQNQGFTLVELIIVITIVAILCGLSAVGILSWQDWATFKKQDEYAKTLFVAAQNQLTEYVANERIIELQEDLLAQNGVDAEGYVIYRAADGIDTVAYNQLSIDGSLDNLWEDGREDVIVSLSAQAGDYDAYLSNPESVSKDKYWLFELLGSYVYDAAILNNGAITVEFTPEDGQVFAVLYTDKHSSFVVDGYNTDDRTEASRRPNMIGYYGVDSLSKATKNTLVKEKINVHKVRLYNKETLYMTYMVDDLKTVFNSSEENTQYTINLLKDDKSSKLLSITFGAPLKSYDADDKIKLATVTKYSESGNTEYTEVPILAWMDKEVDTVHVILDAADIAADTYTYNAAYNNIVNKETGTASEGYGELFRKSYSIFRFGIPVQDIYVSVQAQSDNYTESNVVDNTVAQGAKNIAFAGGDADEYSIRNARHLYNIRYMEVSNAYDERTAESTDGAITFKVNQDIDWDKFQHVESKAISQGVEKTIITSNLYDSSLRITGEDSVSQKLASTSNVESKDKALVQCDFPSIPSLYGKDTIDGNGNTISGLSISQEDNEVYGIYKIPSGTSSADMTLQPVGLVDVNYGTIKNLKMDKLTVSGEDYVGGFVGVNAGKLEKLTLENTLDDKKKDTSIIKGKKNVGGIVGLVLATNDTDKLVTNFKAYDNEYNEVKNQKFVVLTGLTNNARIEGKDGVGGIVGTLTNDFSTIKSSIGEFDGLSTEDKNYISATNSKCNMAVYDCTNKGLVVDNADGSDVGKYFGGIAGYIYNKDKANTYRVNITKCVSTPNIDEGDNMFDGNDADAELAGEYVGGIVGSNNYGQINACQTQSKDNEIGHIFGDKYVGGIAGYNNGIIRNIENSDISNLAYVRGTDYVGGIAGYNDTDAIINNYQVEKGKVIGETDGRFTGGYVGFNSSVDLIMDIDTKAARNIICNPDVVDGGYFTGGIIGGNIINANGLELTETIGINDENTATNKSNPLIYGEVEKVNDTQYKVIVRNNTDKPIVSWRVKINPISGSAEYPSDLKFTNAVWDEKTHYVRPLYYSVINPGGRQEIYFYCTYTTDDDKSDFLDANTNNSVLYFDSNDNTPGTYIGIASNKSDVKVTLNAQDNNYYWYNNTNNIAGQYKIVLKNTTEHVMPNWRIELKLPDGAILTENHNSVSDATIKVENGYLYIIPSADNLNKDIGNNSEVGPQFVIKFNSAEDRAEFNNQTPIVTFNNVLYSCPKELEDSLDFSNGNGSGNETSSTTVVKTEFKKISASFKSDSYKGNVTGKAFVGGYIGYNCIIDNSNKADDQFIANSGIANKSPEYILQKKYIIDAFDKIDDSNNGETDETVLGQKKEVLDSLVETSKVSVVKSSASEEDKAGMYIAGQKSAMQDSVDQSNGLISGEIFVGGVIGYNDDNTILYIYNVANEKTIKATKAIEYAQEQLLYTEAGNVQTNLDGTKKVRNTDYAGNPKIYTYSYAGGILGKASKLTIIDSCSNTTSKTVDSLGTYAGNLCEINEGRIINCEVADITIEKEYYGGLCGLNKRTGLISDCKFEEKTISGKNMISAITSENFGTIKKITFTNPTIKVNSNEDGDGVTGLYAAYNEGTIEIENDLINVNIESKGRYVGAIVGCNNGKLDVKKENATTAITSETRDKALTVTGTVTGAKTVGAFVGKNIGRESINYLLNKASVSATDGEVGGILGENASISKMQYCYNEGSLVAVEAGCAGGLVGLVSAGDFTIENCFNYKDIDSLSITGGLVGQVGTTESGAYLYIDACDNYGNITNHINALGGFVGSYINGEKGLTLLNCKNHGNVTRNLDRTVENITVGGFVGEVKAHAGVDKEVYLEDCVNTGIVSANGANGLSNVNKIGSYIGSSDASVALNLCRNYNTLIPDDTDSTRGIYSAKKYCGSDNDDKLVNAINCLDDTGNNTQGYPVIGVDDDSKVYFVDRSRFDNTNYGVYFNVQDVSGNFRYYSDEYGKYKNNSLYLLEPSVLNNINSVNKMSIVFDYTKTSMGIEAVTAYFSNGLNNVGSEYDRCTLSATYYFEDGSSSNAEVSYKNTNGAKSSYGINDEARAIIKNPNANKKPTKLIITTTGDSKRNMFSGFAFVPVEKSTKIVDGEELINEAVCIYAGDGWDTTFDLVGVYSVKNKNNFQSYNINDIDKSVQNVSIENLNDYLIYDYNYNNYVGKKDVGNSNYLEFDFKVNEFEDTGNIKSFVFYVGNSNDTNVTIIDFIHNVFSTYPEYTYSGEVVFIDKNNTEEVVSFSNVVGKTKKEDKLVTIDIPVDIKENIDSIKLRIKQNGHTLDWGTNTTAVFLRGFGFIPEGEDTVHRLPTDSSDSETILNERLADQVYIPLYVGNNGGYPYLHVVTDKPGVGFSMSNSQNDPLGTSFINDESSRGSYLTSTTSPANSGNRADVYLDMDSKFVDYINRKSSAAGTSSTRARAMSLMAMSFDDFAFEEEDDDTLDSPDVFSLSVECEDLAKGIDFVFDGDAYRQFSDAYGDLVDLEMAIAVYDFGTEDEANGPTDDQKYNMRSSDNANVSWNEGAIETLYSKEAGDTLVLSYDENAYRGHLDIGESYAGKWLKIAIKVRSTNGSMFDSAWSDEDADNNSVNYAWIHIPLVEASEVNGITPTPSPEDAPAITPDPEAGEGAPEVTPEADPQGSPEPTPEATPEVTPQPTPDPTPEVTPEPTPIQEGEGADPTPEVTPDAA